MVVSLGDPSSPAAAAGSERGDLIQEVDRKPVHNLKEYNRSLAGVQGQSVLLLVCRPVRPVL